MDSKKRDSRSERSSHGSSRHRTSSSSSSKRRHSDTRSRSSSVPRDNKDSGTRDRVSKRGADDGEDDDKHRHKRRRDHLDEDGHGSKSKSKSSSGRDKDEDKHKKKSSHKSDDKKKKHSKHKKSKHEHKHKHDKHKNEKESDLVAVPEGSLPSGATTAKEEDDYFRLNKECCLWLLEARGKRFADLDGKEQRKYFGKFCKLWNANKLNAKLYDAEKVEDLVKRRQRERTTFNWGITEADNAPVATT